MKKLVKKARKKLTAEQKWQLAGWACLLLLWVFASVFASQLVVAGLMRGFLNITGITGNSVIINGIYSLISYALALALILLVPPKLAKKWHFWEQFAINGDTKSQKMEVLGVKNGFTWMDIGLAPVAYVAALIISAALTGIFSVFPWFNASEAQDVGFNFLVNGGERMIAFIVLVVLAPVAEEVIFRGWLYGKLRSKLGVVVSTLLVSALFGLVHFQWNVSIDVFALSVVLCALREVTGTVYSGILTHMIKNGVAFFLLYVVGI